MNKGEHKVQPRTTEAQKSGTNIMGRFGKKTLFMVITKYLLI